MPYIRRSDKSRGARASGMVGFTLIELMVVVAIIGVLSSIAIPNYEKYKRRSLTAEAKLAVSSIYSLEKAFYAEYSAYIGALDAIGYTPEGFKRYYNHVITSDGVAAGTVTGYSGAVSGGVISRTNTSFTLTSTYNPASCSGTVLPSTSYGTDPQAFVGYTHGNLGNSTYDDIWTINQVKNLRHCSNGL